MKIKDVDFVRIMREMTTEEAEEAGIQDCSSMVINSRGEKKLTRQA